MEIIFSEATLYNRDTLKKKLSVENSNISNSELILLAYIKWGDQLADYLDGDFSFALYNHEKKHFYCARDPLGIKSFYFTQVKSGYLFSNNIEDLLSHTDVLKKPNLTSMQTLLHQRAVDYHNTMYEGIYRIPPGHFMVIKDSKKEIKRYWFPEKIEIDYSLQEETATKKITELLETAIENRISTLKETAFEVSGGLDSSAIVSLLSQKVPPSSINSYSMVFQGLNCDEDNYINSLLEKYSLQHQKLSVGNLDYHNEMYELKHLYTLSPSWPITLTFAMHLPMLEKIKNDGKKVVITGQGGDHLFTGSPFVLYNLFKRLKFITLARELMSYTKPWYFTKNYILKPLIGENTIRSVKKVFSKRNTHLLNKRDSHINNLSTLLKITDPVFKYDLDLISSAKYSTVMDGNLFHCAEKHFGIEYRHPFFDRHLVEFALTIPSEMKYKNRKIKCIFRKAMNGILPDKIKNRNDKAEFSEVIKQQIDAINLDNLFNESFLVKMGLISEKLINEKRKEYENKTNHNIAFLWSIINIEYWYRYNFHKETLVL